MNSPKLLFLSAALVFLQSCTAQKQVTGKLLSDLTGDTTFRSAHIGISIFDPVEKKYLYNYQGEKYFVPASNTKIVTCYAAMKHLKDSLTGIRYHEVDTAIFLDPTGDPTLLHRDFKNQPVLDFLRQQKKRIFINNATRPGYRIFGAGWSWDDFSDDYMAERNALPVHGNTIKWVQRRNKTNSFGATHSLSFSSEPVTDWKVYFFNKDSALPVLRTEGLFTEFKVRRERNENVFSVFAGPEDSAEAYVPFIANGIQSALSLIADTAGVRIDTSGAIFPTYSKFIFSQPTDSVLRPMMYESDNFFAEQLLMMVLGERFGTINDEILIDSLLHTDLSDLPQEPVWVDGSGLSRYNLFSPQDFVSILDKMQKEFGMARIKTIFPTGDSGTLKNYYRQENGFIYAKTGTLSGVLALSGYLYTKKNRLLIFSVLINNYNGSNATARRRIERFIQRVRNDN